MSIDERYADIPQEMKERRQWVCYRIAKWDTRKKIPYQPRQGGPLLCARSNDPSTWHGFEEVIVATIPVDVSDLTLFEKANSLRNRDKFKRLWDANTGDYIAGGNTNANTR